MTKTIKTISAFALVATLSIIAFASVTFDPATGTGFVGKGDVQLLFGWSNKQLQDNAVNFTYNAQTVTVSEVSWVCTNDKNENTQERERTTTVTDSTTGVVSATARVKNQITGFNLTGFSSSSSTSSNTTEGNPLNSCPSGNNWSLTTPAGDADIISSETTGGLFVNGVELPITTN